MQSEFPCWVNGAIKDTLAVSDRSVAYGDGVFETVRMHPKPVLLSHHMERLTEGLVRLGIPASAEAIQNELLDYQQQFNPGLLKVIVSRGEGGRGYLPPDEPQPKTIIQGFPLPQYSDAWFKEGISLYRCNTPLVVNPALQGVKHLNRLEQVLARQEFSGEDCQEGVMFSTQGYLAEGTMSNIFLVKAGKVYTPGLSLCAVKGTMQRFILSCTDIVGDVIQRTDLQESDILSADDVFLCNSVFGIWPVKTFMGQILERCDRSVVDSLQEIHQKKNCVL